MKGRRPKRHSVICAVLAGLVALVCAGPTFASSALIDLHGRLLSIEVATGENDPARQGLVLVERRLDGTEVRERIEWTFDDALDTSPVLALDPQNGQPIVVWSRQDGGDSDLALTRRYPDGYWTPIQSLTNDSRQDREPRIAVDPDGGLHVLWRGEGRGSPSLIQQSFDLYSGAPSGEEDHPMKVKPRTERPDSQPGNGDDANGGGDDPGVIGINQHCMGTDHGIMIGCNNGITVYQVSGCRLEIGTLDPDGIWQKTRADLGRVADDGSSSTWQIVRMLAGSACSQ